MRTIRMAGTVFLTALLVAGCSDRNTPTAPAAGPLAAASSGGDHSSYTWNLSCSGDGESYANWYWTHAGTTTGTGSAWCFPGGSTSGADARPADADGFFACVNYTAGGGACQGWAVVPGSPFKAQLKGTRTWLVPECSQSCKQSATGTLRIDS